jgi:uncharacterized protein
MNRLAIILFSTLLLACHSGDKTYVFDQEEILTAKQKLELNTTIKEHEARTTNQIAVVTTADLDGQTDILQFATEFGNNHGIGTPEKDNGVVIAVSMSQRKVAIANGYGVENVMPDQVAQQIISQKMIPHFKIGEYYEGILAGTNAVIAYLELPENTIKAKDED